MQNPENTVAWGSHVYGEEPDDLERLGVALGAEVPDRFEARIALEACWRKGPLGICAEIIDGGKSVKVVARLAGRRILRATLSRERQCAETKARVGVAMIELSACADFDARLVRIAGGLCLRPYDGRARSSMSSSCAG